MRIAAARRGHGARTAGRAALIFGAAVLLFPCAGLAVPPPEATPPSPVPVVPAPDSRRDLAAQFGSALPPARAGYSWGTSDAVPFALLRPDGWHWKTQFEGGTYGAFVTLEPIEPPSMRFETGVSVNVILDVPAKTQMTATAWSNAFLKEEYRRVKVLEATPTASGPLQGMSLVSILHEEGLPDVRLATLILANESTGTVYLIRAEAPADSWDRWWPKMEPIMTALAISPDL